MNKLKSLIESGLVDREDGTIFDTRTNLLWQKETSDETYTWKEAKQYCKSLTLVGYTDWRLPTLEELKTLINVKYTPTIDPIFECKPDWYWSSSAHIYGPTYAWSVDFSFGGMYGRDKASGYSVQAVREV